MNKIAHNPSLVDFVHDKRGDLTYVYQYNYSSGTVQDSHLSSPHSVYQLQYFFKFSLPF